MLTDDCGPKDLDFLAAATFNLASYAREPGAIYAAMSVQARKNEPLKAIEYSYLATREQAYRERKPRTESERIFRELYPTHLEVYDLA
jgi:hypothetical protein